MRFQGDIEEQMECLHRVRAQLNHVDEACRSRGRVKSGSVTSELLTVLKARRAGLKWKKKARTSRSDDGTKDSKTNAASH